MKSIPLPDRFIGHFFGCDGGSNLGRLRRISAIAINFSTAAGSAPHIHLTLAAPSQIDPTISGIVNFDFDRLAIGTDFIQSGWQDSRPFLFDGGGRPAPIANHLNVTVFLFGPETGILGIALSVVGKLPDQFLNRGTESPPPRYKPHLGLDSLMEVL